MSEFLSQISSATQFLKTAFDGAGRFETVVGNNLACVSQLICLCIAFVICDNREPSDFSIFSRDC